MGGPGNTPKTRGRGLEQDPSPLARGSGRASASVLGTCLPRVPPGLSGSLSPGWEGGAHGCPLLGKGALLVIPFPPRMGVGGVEVPIAPLSDGFVLLPTHCSNPGYHTPSLS